MRIEILKFLSDSHDYKPLNEFIKSIYPYKDFKPLSLTLKEMYNSQITIEQGENVIYLQGDYDVIGLGLEDGKYTDTFFVVNIDSGTPYQA